MGGTESNCLVVDLRQGESVLAEKAVIRWLRQLPVPVTGLIEKAGKYLDAFDLVLESQDEVDDVLASIDQNPRASAVLTQVTRIVEQLPVEAALVVESLAYATLQGGSEHHDWLRSRTGSISEHVATEPVQIKRDGNQVEILLNSPENRNAFSVAMRDGLRSAFSLVASDPSITAVTVKGAGPCFSAGGDLSEFGTTTDTSFAHAIRQARMPASLLAQCAEKYTFVLHGACVGAGIELPAFAGTVKAHSDAVFRLPEVGMGLIPGAGGCVSITRRIGRHRMNHLAISGREISAQLARQWGLLDEVGDVT